VGAGRVNQLKYGERCVVVMPSDVEKDIQTLRRFIEIYCRGRHREADKSVFMGVELCGQCRETLEYASRRRELCPLDPKPACKKCKIHCYEPEQRERIREVMRPSGMHLITRGRLDLILHYWL